MLRHMPECCSSFSWLHARTRAHEEPTPPFSGASCVQSKVSELKTAACALFGLEEKDVELLDYFNGGLHCTLEDKTGQSLHEAHINEGQHILLGEQVHRQPNPAIPALYWPARLLAPLHLPTVKPCMKGV